MKSLLYLTIVIFSLINIILMNCNQRKASHWGTWYEQDSDLLNQELDYYLENAKPKSPKNLKAVIVPHAGIEYSGKVAAWSYKSIDPSKYKRIFIIGQFHISLNKEGCFLPKTTSYETPFGDLEIDTLVVQELALIKGFEFMNNREDEDEHVIELQLPFVKKLFAKQDIRIVPIITGSTTLEMDKLYGEALAKYYSDNETLFILSTDFCHWGGHHLYFEYNPDDGAIYEFITKLDRKAFDLIEALDIEGFDDYLKKTKNTICGARVMSIMISMLNSSSISSEVKFINYDMWNQKINSFDEETVAYASALIYIKDE